MDGICTLANDKVYHQLIALLNSIDAIYGKEMPVCVYPYDDNTEKIAKEISLRPHVQLYNQEDSIRQWDEFVRHIWDIHPTAQVNWKKVGLDKYHRIGTHRRYCAFDGPFDRFVYMDADTLLMSPLDHVFSKLDEYDWVVYDFQYKDLSHVYNQSASKLKKIFTKQQLHNEIFCSGFYGSKKGMFTPQQRELLLKYLSQGEAGILYHMAPDQTILNYMVMRLGISSYNFALQIAKEDKTGCCITSTHFQSVDNILYDKSKRLTYIHYIGLSSQLFNQVCSGENIDFPYRDLFLYYRYLHEPDKFPKFTTKVHPYDCHSSSSFGRKLLSNLRFPKK
ncbi:hypothetical protein B6N60_05038 [Richelia sinica FACHB-800]|uniref:Sugar transferase n=1 Tax=Richelia sinica FACHB-800 TaxID=1357546 RepID=A0A975Y7H5_9NOST|nr:Npun_R2821/Npun_R2822 family protein [Richelia sinica]MBD2663963.1 sugar transferase [Richelia sinica FACHB-800]QXE26307.1 hypothetical protein B6N60_05038 [Richelia sinica FACHB-800]